MTVEELTESPSLGRLYATAVATSRGRGGDTLPDLEVVLPGVTVDRDHLAAYDDVCGFRFGDVLPATYVHVLAFPLAVRVMTDRAFPFPLVGLVHVANRIEVRRPVEAGETLDLRVRAENLRAHPRGRQLDLVAEATVDGEPVWTGTSTYLRRGGRAPDGSGNREGRDDAGRDDAQPRQVAVWPVPGDTGRRYAAVSGDRNPIHLHPLAARAFGFPRAIAHGMWTKARCLAAYEGRLPDAFTVDVDFRAPVLLPSRVAFSTTTPLSAAGTRTEFALRDPKRGRRHLGGVLTPT